MQAGAARVVEVSEAEIAEAMRTLYRLDPTMSPKAPEPPPWPHSPRSGARQVGKRVGVILSGGNVDAEVFRAVLAGEVP